MAVIAGFHVPVGAEGPDGPRRLLGGLTAEVHPGHAPSGMTPEALGELGRALDAAGAGPAFEIHPRTVHGFTMSDTGAFGTAALRRRR
ncbi:hypothetical protein ACWGIU_12345 [Streptomyces sp. NPDC054840]